MVYGIALKMSDGFILNLLYDTDTCELREAFSGKMFVFDSPQFVVRVPERIKSILGVEQR
jgi:hypothetical protein